MSTIKYYMNNPCEVIREITPEFSEVKVYKTFDDEMCGRDWCVGCLAGHTDGTPNSHDCYQYDDVIEALRDEESAIIVIVENRLLADEPVEFKAWDSVRKDIESMRSQRDDVRKETLDLRNEKSRLEKEIPYLVDESRAVAESLARKIEESNACERSANKARKELNSMEADKTRIQVADNILINISLDELRDLIYDSRKLHYLEVDGVDNWEWYGESFPEDLDEEADSILKTYKLSVGK